MRWIGSWCLAGALVWSGCGKEDGGAPEPAVVDKAKPAEAKPEVKSTEVKSTESQPAEVKSAEGQPAEVKSAEVKSAEVKSAEVKPAEAKPAAPKTRKLLKKDEIGKAAEDFKAFQALLNEGRKLVKDDKPLEGMAKYEEALKKVPGHPSALGELGWAAYRAGAAHFDRALQATRQALSVSKKDKQKGALYYNLGRISEDQGNLELALESYRKSLAHRPGNETVQKQLEALVGKLGGKGGSDGIDKLDAVCLELGERWDCEVTTSAEGQVMSSCDCATEILGPEEGFGRAALVRLTGMAEGAVDSTFLVIEVASKWHVVREVGLDWSPGMGSVWNSSTRDAFEFADIGGQKVAWVVYQNSHTDLDPGIYTEYGNWEKSLTLCAMTGSTPGCWAVPLGSGSSVSKLSFDGEIPPGEGPAEEKNERWELSVARDGDAIVLTLKSGNLPEELKGLPGRYTLSDLPKAPGVVVQVL